MDDKNIFFCIDCKLPYKKKVSNHIRCLECSNKNKPKKNNSNLRICEACFLEFNAILKNEKFCNANCKKLYKDREINEKWMQEKKKKKPQSWKGSFVI